LGGESLEGDEQLWGRQRKTRMSLQATVTWSVEGAIAGIGIAIRQGAEPARGVCGGSL
jgi:hypothetical protein